MESFTLRKARNGNCHLIYRFQGYIGRLRISEHLYNLFESKDITKAMNAYLQAQNVITRNATDVKSTISQAFLTLVSPLQ